MEVKEKFLCGEALTSYETYQTIQYLINQSRIENNVLDDDLMKCEECAIWICRDTLCINRYPFNFNIFNTKDLGFKDNFHYFSIVEFNTLNGRKNFIIDPVFEQFNTDKYRYTDDKIIDAKDSFNNDEDFLNRLSKERYLELTEKNVYKYISGLVTLGNQVSNNIEVSKALSNFNKKLDKNNLCYSKGEDLLINEQQIIGENRLKLIAILKKERDSLINLENNTRKIK